MPYGDGASRGLRAGRRGRSAADGASLGGQLPALPLGAGAGTGSARDQAGPWGSGAEVSGLIL